MTALVFFAGAFVGMIFGLGVAAICTSASTEPEIPAICAWCRRAMDDDGNAVETSHGLCGTCREREEREEFSIHGRQTEVPPAPSPDPTGADGADFKAQENARRNQ